MKLIKEFISIISILTLSIGAGVWRQIRSVDRLIVKNDEESLDNFLKSDADKAKFMKEVDRLVKENGESTKININNKDITISI